VKGGGAIGLGRVDVDLLLEQSANRVSIRAHDRVHQSIAARGSASQPPCQADG
jgi:hypothetical protein